jgi:propionyl-CoA carboxylase alpha chain
MSNARFMSGDMSTNFIAEEYPDGFLGAELTSDITKVFLSVATHIYLTDAKRAAAISSQLDGRPRQIGTRWVVAIDGAFFPVYVQPNSTSDGYVIRYEREKLFIRSNWILGSRLLRATINEKTVSVKIDSFAGGYYLTHAGRTVKATVRSPRVAELEQFMPTKLRNTQATCLEAPISGMIAAVKVATGTVVKAGQELLIIEAMKMENTIYAEQDCVIASTHAKQGDSVNAGQLLLEFE